MAYLHIGSAEMAAIAALAILLSPLLLIGGAVAVVAVVAEDAGEPRRRRAADRLNALRSSVEMESALQKLYADTRETRTVGSFTALGAALMIHNDPVSAHHYLYLASQAIPRHFLPSEQAPTTLEEVIKAVEEKLVSVINFIPQNDWDWEVKLGYCDSQQLVSGLYFYGMNLLCLRDFAAAKDAFLQSACMAHASQCVSQSVTVKKKFLTEWDALTYAAYAAYLEIIYADSARPSYQPPIGFNTSKSLLSVAVPLLYPIPDMDKGADDGLRSALSLVELAIGGSKREFEEKKDLTIAIEKEGVLLRDVAVSSRSLLVRALIRYRLAVSELQRHSCSSLSEDAKENLDLSSLVDTDMIASAIQDLEGILNVISDDDDDEGVVVEDVHVLLSQCHAALGHADKAASQIESALRISSETAYPKLENISSDSDTFYEILFRPPLLSSVSRGLNPSEVASLRPHSFISKRILKPTWCVSCLNRISMFEGDIVQCTLCQEFFHGRCSHGDAQQSNPNIYCFASFLKEAEREERGREKEEGEGKGLGESESAASIRHHHCLGARPILIHRWCGHCAKAIMGFKKVYQCKTCSAFFHPDCGPQLDNVMIEEYLA